MQCIHNYELLGELSMFCELRHSHPIYRLCSPSLFSTIAISYTNSKRWLELIPWGRFLLIPVIFCFFRLFGLRNCWEAAINPYTDRRPKILKLIPSGWTSTFVGVPFLDHATGRALLFFFLQSQLKKVNKFYELYICKEWNNTIRSTK